METDWMRANLPFVIRLIPRKCTFKIMPHRRTQLFKEQLAIHRAMFVNALRHFFGWTHPHAKSYGALTTIQVRHLKQSAAEYLFSRRSQGIRRFSLFLKYSMSTSSCSSAPSGTGDRDQCCRSSPFPSRFCTLSICPCIPSEKLCRYATHHEWARWYSG